jgi:dolichol-phosphate mannosyltransferase
MRVSVISPVYMAEKIVDELVKRISESVAVLTTDFEIILVEDGSPDNSWQKIKENSAKDTRVKGIKLSRNFGQHHAITAGLDHATGDWIIVMDCDLQDDPAQIKNLYLEAQKGYDIVFARRINRKDNFNKKITSKLFYLLFTYLSGIEQDGTISNYGIYHKKVIKAVSSMREPLRAFSPMVRQVGFKKSFVNVEHQTRYVGKSSYSWKKLINLAIDISVSYSEKPLRLVVFTGLLLFVIGFILAFIFSSSNAHKISPTSFQVILLVSIWLVGGLIIFLLGIVSVYIGKVFEAAKGRPLYFIDETINL